MALNRELLRIPADYIERTPSEGERLTAEHLGIPVSEQCSDGSTFDATYFSEQVDEPWRDIIGISDERKLPDKLDPDYEKKRWVSRKDEKFVERSPSETYLEFVKVTGQQPDVRYLEVVRGMDETYKAGQEELQRIAAASCSTGK